MKIKDFKSNIFTWLNEPKRLNRLTLYFSLGAVAVLASHLAFSYFGFLHTDVDSARYMLSALVQSEAAIVALVVTLSLVAVQLAAQSYSARVIEVFRRTPDLWILMGIYGVAIFYGLGVLKLIEKANPQVDSLSNLEGYVAFSYYLGVFAFVALVPYIWNTLEMLKPSTVINMLAERITKQSLLSATKEEVEEISDDEHLFNFAGWADEGPLSPIVDILHSSMRKYDYETVRIGLRTIKDRVNHIFNNETFNKEEERKVSIYIFKNLTGVGQLAASRKDERSILEVITNFQKIGINVALKGLVVATQFSVIDLSNIGKIAAELKFEEATRKIVQSLEDIGKIAPTIEAIRALEKVGVAAAEQELEVATYQAAKSLEAIGILAAKQNFENITKEVASIIGKIGIAAAQQKLVEATHQAAKSLETVGLAATEQESEEVSKQVAFSLGMIGITSTEQAPLAIFQVVESLKIIGLAAAKHNFKSSIKQAVISLEIVLKDAKEHNLEVVYQEAEEYLKELNDALNKL